MIMIRTQIRNKILSAFTAVAITVSCLLAAGGFAVSAEVGQPELPVPALSDVHCASYCVYDKTTDMYVISYNMNEKIYPASQTKIMTCMLALDYLDTTAKLTTSETAMATVTADSSVMGIVVGEKVKVSELLYGLMLPSGTDAANVLAEGVIDVIFEKYPETGTETGPDGVNAQYFIDALGDTRENILANRKIEAFALLMNLRAEAIGCDGTHFTNACGLHDENHYTTARDLTQMIAAASENDDFKTLISSPSHVFQATNMHRADAWAYVKSTDYLLFDPWLACKTANGTDSHLAAVVGGKTGTTSAAGKGVTIYTVNENGHELMISICGIPAEYYFYTTMYLASVTAHGHLACWENDPVSRIPGTTGDYRTVNAPASEQPEFDPLHFPGDELADYSAETEDASGETDPAAETDPNSGGEQSQTDTPSPTPDTQEGSPLVLFIKNNKEVSILIGSIMTAIMILNIVLIIRINKMKHPKVRKTTMRKGNHIGL